MKPSTSHKNLLIWQKARLLVKEAYALVGDLRDFAFKDQFQRAAISVMNNIAEGSERGSNRDFSRFLVMAKGSCGELSSMTTAGADLGYFGEKEAVDFEAKVEELMRMIGGLMRKIDTSNSTLATRN